MYASWRALRPDAATTHRMPFAFDNTYARELAGTYVSWQPVPVSQPRLLFFNRELAAELRLDADALDSPLGEALFAGNAVPEGAEPIAQAYAGHQFGGFSPQLGDGRALLLGEVVDRCGKRRDIALKGSGRTPFSRGGDGRAAVGPVLREVLIGESMHALGIPTTRALAAVATGEPVFRERPLPGAVLTRVASSHLRVGTFEFFAARDDRDTLRRLAEYAIRRHDPGLAGDPDRYLGLLEAVARRQARLVAQWMNVGFLHGVMNTDNMTVSGETIDYGPCAFLEAYDPATVFSSIDEMGRYAYANQPRIARWNLARFAETLVPLLVDPADEAAVREAVARLAVPIDAFPGLYDDALRAGLHAKLGLRSVPADEAQGDRALADDWLELLQAQRVDFTLAWRRLADAAQGNEAPLRALFADDRPLEAWLSRWHARCARDDALAGSGRPARSAADTIESAAGSERARRMRSVNPWVIPRNHRVEEALASASDGDDLEAFEQLLAALRRPFDESPAQAYYAEPAPPEQTAAYRTFCGT